jgi:hypothetical protein
MNLREEILRIKNISNFLHNKTILSEGKLEELTNKYRSEYGDTYDGIIEDAYEGDPSPSKKYFTWISKIFIERDQAGMDININDLISLIQYFDKNQHKFEKKDIYQYTYDEFIKKYEEAITKISKREMALSGVEKLYEDDKYVLVRPKNKEASCKYGSNTKWCIASNTNNYFNNYSDENLFFFVIDKLREPIPGRKKSQNYFKIAIQYNPNSSMQWHQYSRDEFLRGSQEGVITYWNAIDDEVSPSTVKKYVDKDLLKEFIKKIREYTYKLYAGYYDSQVKKKESFDESKLKDLELEFTQKNKELKTAQRSYNATKAVKVVNESLALYRVYMEYSRVMKLPPKEMDEFLNFINIKDNYYKSLKVKEGLDIRLDTINNELNQISNKIHELRRQQNSIYNYINFGEV